MMNWRLSLLVMILIVTLMKPAILDAQRAVNITVKNDSSQMNRLALVIGNGAYQKSPLRNPVNDAEDMAVMLKKLGFTVIRKINADQRVMEESIRGFGRQLREGGVGLFYYAGHGIQLAGHNYLIPVGAVLESEGDVKYEAVDAGLVLAKMEDAGNGMNIIILDACRDNPFARSFRSASIGLAKMDSPEGSILVYATKPGGVAADGKGRNGIYTHHLLRRMNQRGLTIERVLKQVRIDVMKATGKKQVPWESSSLTGDFFFAPVVIKPTPQSALLASGEDAVPLTKATMFVSTEPSGADVYVNGRRLGVSPKETTLEAPATVTVRAEKNGYESIRERVRLSVGQRLPLTLRLKKMLTTGSIKVTSEPSEANIYLDGAYVGSTPETLTGVDAGSHTVKWTKDGYKPQSKTVRVASGHTQHVSVSMAAVVSPTEASTGKTWRDPTTGMEFVWVPKGCFQMGSNDGQSNERPVHEVCVDGFWLGKYEVTQGQWEKLMGYNPSGTVGNDNPVEQVLWDDAQKFIETINHSTNGFRLPTEAEWEYAARAGSVEKYSFGNSDSQLIYYAWYMSNSGVGTHPVGQKKANAWGLHDMHGNVKEWTADRYANYSSGRKSNPKGPLFFSIGRVFRGGGWDSEPGLLRSSHRDKLNRKSWDKNLGFRLVKEQ